MKKIIFILSFISVWINSSAQTGAPQLINYQAIARDAAGNVITTAIGVKFEILQTAGMTLVYAETQTITPSASGIFTAAIGAGPATAGTFSLINWGLANHYIRVSIDPTGGTSYTSLGTSQLLSVPFALYSEKTKAPNVSVSGNTLTINGSTVTLPGAASSPTITGSGITTVNQAGNSFTVSTITPTLIGVGSTTVSGSYPVFTISSSATGTAVAGSNTITGVGVATVSPLTGNNFTVNVPPTNLSYNSNNGTISYSPAIGINTINITPTLSLAAGILTVGPPSNTLNLSTSGPWTKPTATTVVLNNNLDLVGIGTNAPGAKLEVTDNTGVNVLNVSKTTPNGEAANFSIINPANGFAVIDANTNGSGNVILAATSGSGYSGNFSKSGSGTAFISSHTGTIGAAGSFNINNASNNSTALAVTTNGSGDAGSFSTTGNGNGLYAQAGGTGSSISAFNVGSGRAIYGSNTSSVMTMQLSNTGTGDGMSVTVGQGRVLYAQNSSNAYSTIEASNNGGGNVYFGSKPAGVTTGNVANLSNNSTVNSSDAVSIFNAGPASALHVVSGPMVAGGSNVSAWFDNGHIKSTQVNPPVVTTFSVNLGATSITYTLSGGASDVKGNLLAVITTTGMINANGSETVKITFNKTYSAPPTVILTPTSDFGGMSYYVSSVNTTGFQITFKNNTGTNILGNPLSYSFNYFVIE